MKRLIATLALGLALNASPAVASSATEAALAADPFGRLRITCGTHQLASPSPIKRPRCRVNMRWRMRAISARS